MTDERAALLITAYADGLRRELSLLGASEITDSVSEIVAMLRDASEGDPDAASAEIDRLGPPEELARTILEQHGLHTGPGTPAPSWWRLGVAAPIDILVGLAAPAAGVALAVSVFASWGADGAVNVMSVIAGLVACIAVVLTGTMAWRYWRPWREGGRSTTVGLTLTGISIVRVGATRTVALTKDLATAGLDHARYSRLGTVLTLVVALAVLAWSATSLAGSALAASGVDRLVGNASAQQGQVRVSLDDFYAPLVDPSVTDARWPSAWIDPAGIDGESLDSVVARVRSPQLRSYRILSMTSPSPGVWVVTVEEVRTTTRAVLVTMGLRANWLPGGVSSTWTIIGYQPK